MDEAEIKKLLLKQSKEFKRLYDAHQSHEKRLEFLKAKGFLTEEEKLEEREVKKLKLALKDRMYRLMEQYRKSP